MKIDINRILTDPKIDSLDPVSLRWLLDVLLAVRSNSVPKLIDTVLTIIDYYSDIVTENVTCNAASLQQNVTCNEKTLQENVTSLQKTLHNVTRNVTPLSGAERTRRCRERKNAKNGVTCNEKTLQNVTQEKEKSTKKEKEIERELFNSQQINLFNNNLIDNNSTKNNSENLKNNSENELNTSENNLKIKNNTVNLTARDKKSNEARNEVCNDNSTDCNETSVTCNEKKSVTQKQKLSPDQPEYWKRAFGSNAEMAERFYRISGILPIESEFGRWQKDLKNLAEAHISIEQMEAAVIKLKQDGITIGAPGSVFKTARSIAAPKPIVPSEKTESIMDVARRLQREEDLKEMRALP